jgi:uncharacterized protein (TIGR00255 family)
MIQSMTGFGSAQATGDIGTINVDIKSVNSRYLDLTFRMPDELRLAEMPLRELVGQSISRGKVEVRASFTRAQKDLGVVASAAVLVQVQAAYEQIKSVLPQTAPPTFADVLQWSDLHKTTTDPASWVGLCQTAAVQALEQLTGTRAREGSRLAQVICEQANQAQAIVDALKTALPDLLKAQSDRVAKRMREAFEQASPGGLAHISAVEISERLHAEASLFSLRADVAEELDRLTLHVTELLQTLEQPDRGNPNQHRPAPSRQRLPSKGIGKRLDFLFQEMNREANTLGSKAVDMRLTRAAVDLKLLIEQMREQIQNIE